MNERMPWILIAILCGGLLWTHVSHGQRIEQAGREQRGIRLQVIELDAQPLAEVQTQTVSGDRTHQLGPSPLVAGGQGAHWPLRSA